ncbi:geranylgeranylglyceryl/heptaprenylglyceryl phosphate synthase [Candidatus Bathyarchaeota archaeon]|nr:MAG: geranylgeranylglyceryl/heptaprenylglyceryl phosphate synthase [Candidatus Bathyarchaeota archaeon]
MGKVEKYLKEKIRKEGAVHFTLIDPEKTSPEEAEKICVEAEKAGTGAILLGGSTTASSNQVEAVAKKIKKSISIPLILFPGNLTGLTKFADAIFFMSLLNSSNPYFFVDVQALAAPLVKKYQIETLSLGYVILGYGGTAGFVGYARPIPYEKAELAAMYALAAQYFGMRFVYLEAGSGAEKPIPPKTISVVRREVDIPLIVGGGIRNRQEVKEMVKAGANIIVTGTVVEEVIDVGRKISEFVEGIKEAFCSGG